jgi:hypothetical protein
MKIKIPVPKFHVGQEFWTLKEMYPISAGTTCTSCGCRCECKCECKYRKWNSTWEVYKEYLAEITIDIHEKLGVNIYYISRACQTFGEESDVHPSSRMFKTKAQATAYAKKLNKNKAQ